VRDGADSRGPLDREMRERRFHPAAMPPVHSLVPDDLAIEMLPIFSSR
jgi:hypothetical protein